MDPSTRKLDLQRRLVAYKTMAAWQEIPHVSYLYEPDATELLTVYRRRREEFAGKGIKLSLNTLLLKAVALGLGAAPELNMSFAYDPAEKQGELTENAHIHLGVPWVLPDGGMMTLTVFGCEGLSLEGIAAQVEELRQRVEKTDFNKLFLETAGALPAGAFDPRGGLSPEHITGSTVTVSNIGSICRSPGHFGLLEILPPQIFVVGISAAQDRPGVYTDAEGRQQIGVRKILPICLAFDHRALDFGSLVPFLQRMDKIFAEPEEALNW